MSSTKVEIEKFNGEGDYMLWREKLEAQVDLLGLVEYLDYSSIKDDPEESIEDSGKGKKVDEKQKNARSAIILSLQDNVLRKVIKQKDPRRMMKLLDNLYMSKSLSARIHLKQKLFSFTMQSSLTIEKNIDHFLRIVSDLENVDVIISDEDQALMLLMSLPGQFEGLKDTLRYSKTSLTLEEVITAIQSKEVSLGSQSKESKQSAEALYVKGKQGQENKNQKFDSKGKKSKNKDKSKKTCWECGEQGHYKMQCPNKGKESKFGYHKHGESSCVNEAKNHVDVLVVNEALNISDSQLENKWVIDSGCSFHMTWREDLFIDLHKEAGGTVRMANNSENSVKGIGSVKVTKSDGSAVILTKVRFVSGIKRNLISLGSLEDAGCAYHFENGAMNITKDGRVMLQGRRNESLYFLMTQEDPAGEVSQVDSGKVSKDYWHSRLGHLGQKILVL